MKAKIAAIALLMSGATALAQHQHNRLYAGMQQRDIKALSDQQIADLRAGRGMELALAAELNGYPGPIHVLELADQLQLTEQQKQQMRERFDAMKTEALPMGEKLIQQEKALDAAFAQRTITPAALAELTTKIGQTQGELRAIHLKYHLTTADLLSMHQRHQYAQLRGYH